MNACGLFISVIVGGGSTYEYVHLPSHRLLLEKLSFPDTSMKCREVPSDWSLSVAVDILTNQLVARQVISSSSHPTKKQTSKLEEKSPRGPWKTSALPHPGLVGYPCTVHGEGLD